MLLTHKISKISLDSVGNNINIQVFVHAGNVLSPFNDYMLNWKYYLIIISTHDKHRNIKLDFISTIGDVDVALLIRVLDQRAADAGSIPWCAKGFCLKSHLSVQTLLWCLYTSVCHCTH